jgi:hypothetical protein
MSCGGRLAAGRRDEVSGFPAGDQQGGDGDQDGGQGQEDSDSMPWKARYRDPGW